MNINKRDLIRFIGDRLHEYYKRGALTVLPTYDTHIVHEETNLSQAIKGFFIQPYYDLLDYRDALPEDSLDRLAFEQKYPKLEYEVGEVAQLISAAIKDYLSLVNQADSERELLSRLHIDEKTREAVKETISSFGRVTDGRRKN